MKMTREEIITELRKLRRQTPYRPTLFKLAAIEIEAASERERGLMDALRRAIVLAGIASDWDLGTDGEVEIDDKWVSCSELRREFKQALKSTETEGKV